MVRRMLLVMHHLKKEHESGIMFWKSAAKMDCTNAMSLNTTRFIRIRRGFRRRRYHFARHLDRVLYFMKENGRNNHSLILSSSCNLNEWEVEHESGWETILRRKASQLLWCTQVLDGYTCTLLTRLVQILQAVILMCVFSNRCINSTCLTYKGAVIEPSVKEGEMSSLPTPTVVLTNRTMYHTFTY